VPARPMVFSARLSAWKPSASEGLSPEALARIAAWHRLCLAVRLQSCWAVGVAPRLRHGGGRRSAASPAVRESCSPALCQARKFYPVSAIDYLTGYLMAFGALVALARAALRAAVGSCGSRWRRPGAGSSDAGQVPRQNSRTCQRNSPLRSLAALVDGRVIHRSVGCAILGR